MNVKKMCLFLLLALLVAGTVFSQSVARDGVVVTLRKNGSTSSTNFWFNVENTNNYLVNVEINYTYKNFKVEKVFTKQVAVAAKKTDIVINSNVKITFLIYDLDN